MDFILHAFLQFITVKSNRFMVREGEKARDKRITIMTLNIIDRM